MANKKRMIPLTAIAAFILAAVAAINFYLDRERMIEEMSAHRSAYAELETTLQNARQRAEADERFIAGDYDAAMELYQAYGDRVGSDELYLSRRSVLGKSDNLRASMLSGRDESVRRQMEQVLREEMAAADSLFALRKDSVRTELTAEINRLNELLAEKESTLAKRLPHEHLVFYSKNGNRTSYYGAVANGKANGQGMGYYNTGNAYIGPWKDNMKHGENGVYRWIGGERYEGSYKKDRRDGNGTYYWANGEKYEGEWKDDRRNGYGVLYDKDHNIQLKGTWKDGELIQPAN